MISLDDITVYLVLFDWHPAGKVWYAFNFSGKKAQKRNQSWFAFNQNYKAAGDWTSIILGNTLYLPMRSPTIIWSYCNGKFKLSEQSTISLLFNNLGYKSDAMSGGAIVSSKVNNMQTMGGNWLGNYGRLKPQITAYYQSAWSCQRKNKSAYLLSGALGYQASKPLNLTWALIIWVATAAKMGLMKRMFWPALWHSS